MSRLFKGFPKRPFRHYEAFRRALVRIPAASVSGTLLTLIFLVY